MCEQGHVVVCCGLCYCGLRRVERRVQGAAAAGERGLAVGHIVSGITRVHHRLRKKKRHGDEDTAHKFVNAMTTATVASGDNKLSPDVVERKRNLQVYEGPREVGQYMNSK